VALAAFVRSTKNVSFDPSAVSPRTGTANGLLVSPRANVTVVGPTGV